MNKGLQTLQIGFFLRSIDLSDKLSLTQKIKEGLSLDGEVSILPIPDDAPSEIPRIILKEKTSSLEVQISALRADIVFKALKKTEEGIPDQQIENISESVIAKSKKLCMILNHFSGKTSRLAIIANTILKLDISSRRFMISKYIKKNDFDESQDIRLHVLNKKDLGNFKANMWRRFETLQNIENPEDDKALRILIDVNTLAEIEYDFSKVENIQDFLTNAFALILEEYKKAQI